MAVGEVPGAGEAEGERLPGWVMATSAKLRSSDTRAERLRSVLDDSRLKGCGRLTFMR